MDKNNSRKLRMAPGKRTAQNDGMSEDICNELLAQATCLAHRTFDKPTDEHVQCVYHRLMLNWRQGAGSDGAMTVH